MVNFATHFLAFMAGGTVAMFAFALCTVASDAERREEQDHGAGD